MNQPITISVALGGLLSTGVALVAIFVPGIEPTAQAAIIAFGNAAILTGSVIWAQARSTPTAAPVLEQGTKVTVVTPESEPNRVVTL